MNKLLIPLLILAVLFTGCSFFAKRPIKATTHRVSIPTLDGKVVQPEILRKGGKILVVPFSPGPQTEASDELDKLSLMIVKGIADVFQPGGPFVILDDTNADTADLLIKGKIMEVRKATHHPKWLPHSNLLLISVEGKVIDRAGSSVVAVFSHSRKVSRKKENMEDLAVDVGRDIGKFILPVESSGQ